jgi:microcystin degradation protein MlrC
MKILVGECKQEVSSFNPVPSRYTDFDISWGQELVDFHHGLNTEMCGALGSFAGRGDVAIAPAYSARARTSGGTLARPDYARIRREFMEGVRAAFHGDGAPVDGIYLSLHGAMAAEGEDDPEGALLAEVRAIVGERIPLVVSLDLHGVLTPRMLSHCDAIVAYHTYPHVDFATTGERAARLLMRILNGEVRPVTAVVPIPALVRGNELITATGLFGQSIRRAQAIEAGPGGLSAGMFIGNPFTDVAGLRSNSFVVIDDDPVWAEREAIALATEFWAVRERLQAPLVPLAEAVEIAKQATGAVILTDAADATSSGASGDSNLIVRGLLDAGYTGKVLAPIVDPAAVQAALAAGVGNTVETTVGGRRDPARFAPLPIRARVALLSDGQFISESNGALWDAGPSAVLVAEHVTWVAASQPVSLYDRSFFYAHGQEPRRFDAIVVKSPHCQPHMFDEWAGQTVNVDVPGSTSANLKTLGHRRCARPIFPLDPEVSFTPRAQLYRRT